MICGWSPPSAPRSRSGGAYFAAMADGSGRGLFLLGAVGMDVGWVSWTETETEAEAEAEAAGESAGVSVAEMSLRGIALRALFFCGTGFVFQAAVMPELRDGSPLIVSSPLALSSFVFLFFIAIAVTTFKTSPTSTSTHPKRYLRKQHVAFSCTPKVQSTAATAHVLLITRTPHFYPPPFSFLQYIRSYSLVKRNPKCQENKSKTHLSTSRAKRPRGKISNLWLLSWWPNSRYVTSSLIILFFWFTKNDFLRIGSGYLCARYEKTFRCGFPHCGSSSVYAQEDFMHD